MNEQEKFYKLPASTVQAMINFLNQQPVVQLLNHVAKAELIEDCDKEKCKNKTSNKK